MYNSSRPEYTLSLSLVVLLALMSFTPLYSQKTIHVPFNESHFSGWVPGQIVVNFDPSLGMLMNRATAVANGLTGIEQVDRLGRQIGIRSIKQQFHPAGVRSFQGRIIDLSGWYHLQFADSIPVDSACNLYIKLSGVLEAQPIGLHTVDMIPNDGFYIEQWHLNQSGDHDIDAPEAWDKHTGNPLIIVGVLDTGIRYYHKDLGGANASSSTPFNANGNMWLNTGETGTALNNGIDDDGNGYTDDWIGWDFVSSVSGGGQLIGEDYDTPDNNPADFNGHGTHCAGNISAINNNGYGSASAAGGWGNGTLQAAANGVKIMALRIGYSMRYMGQENGFVQMDYAAQAIQYAADNGARIISCSWGSSNSGGIADAINYFLAGGGLIFKAAGNEGSSTADYICGRSDANIISVAATDSSDLKADFSNFGTWVDISAPGVDILSSYHVHSDPTNDYVATLSGTSMATPIAASTAALIWGYNPSLTAGEVRQILLAGADDIDALNPVYAGELGAGRVNAYTPFLDSSLPVELGSFTARYDSGDVILEWETFSELGNLGFEIFREIGDTGKGQLIASYRENDSLLGLGNSSFGQRYRYVDQRVVHGFIYRYRLYDVGSSAIRTPHGPVSVDTRRQNGSVTSGITGSENFHLSVFPNPFNSSATIAFTLPGPEYTTLKIYNVLGAEVRTLIAEHLPAGPHQITFDGSQLASGVYYYQVTAGDPSTVLSRAGSSGSGKRFRTVKKMILLR